MSTDLSKFNIGNYYAGSKWMIVLWYSVNYFIFDSVVPWPYRFKTWLLRLFGAHVGSGVIIKTKVRIKYPWKLVIGSHCWIGESCWIDNLAQVTIGSHVALSQGSMLLTGNHDYTDVSFPYRLGEIVLEDGVWIGARSIVCPGVVCKTNSILTVNSVATQTLDAYGIFSGNPAVFVRPRKFRTEQH
jgi:putative colanic acid biosynthesis acetyltransferase WcaF